MTGRGEYRSIYAVLPHAPEFQRLSKDARLFFYTLKLELGPLGIATVYDEPLCAATGMTKSELSAARLELVEGGWLIISGRVHWLRNGLRFEPTLSLENKKHVAFIDKELHGLPCCAIANAFADYYELDRPFPGCGKDTLSPHPGNGYPGTSESAGNNTPPHPTPTTPQHTDESLPTVETSSEAGPRVENLSREALLEAGKGAIAARFLPTIREKLRLGQPASRDAEKRDVSVLAQWLEKGWDPWEVDAIIDGFCWERDHGRLAGWIEPRESAGMVAMNRKLEGRANPREEWKTIGFKRSGTNGASPEKRKRTSKLEPIRAPQHAREGEAVS